MSVGATLMKVAVAGASGYAGGELLRLIGAHPEFELVAATANQNAGERIRELHPQLVSYGEQTFAETNADVLAAADLVFLALPHGASAAVAAELPQSVKIVDLGADFRLEDASAWAKYYPGPHAGTWTYGLPELPGQRAKIAASSRVANTGCYAVSIITALAPLVAAAAVDPADVVVVASSGASGAGRSPSVRLLSAEVMGALTAYRVGGHQHVPEILQATSAHTMTFTPILAPITRGILSTVTAKPLPGVTAEQCKDVLAAAYADERFIHVLAGDTQPKTSSTFGSNSVHLQVVGDTSSARVIVTSAIDNLGKGAAGQAVQNANLMLGFDEGLGLSVNGIAP